MASTNPYTPKADFSSVPIIDFSLLSSPSTKPIFISQLRHALINVGFFYLSNHPILPTTMDSFVSGIPKFFALPQEQKNNVKMANSPHFLGYLGLGEELTKGTVDNKEVFYFSTRYEKRPEEEEAKDYWRMYGPAQWPDERAIPGFREVAEGYFGQLADLSYTFISLLAEAFGLAPDAFNKFFTNPEKIQHRGSIIKYPVVREVDAMGVGPHFDSGFFIFLLQASAHRGLQVQNLAGDWIDVTPIPGTLVVNIGKGLEFVTRGLARATFHRVISPCPGPGEPETPRYSVPFFQNISPDVCLADSVLDIPPEILALKQGTTDPLNNNMEHDRESAGMVKLIGRIKSHPDIAEKHYPDLFKKYFPNGYVA